ncbi:MAG: GNAT family N-acetyltransferase, partial [Anaerolineae bacterium]
LGEWLLLALMDEMEAQGARITTLEVRISNAKARALYEHLGFQEEGRRHRYYSDNGEDALIMSTSDLGSPAMQALRKEHQRQVCQRLRAWLCPGTAPP